MSDTSKPKTRDFPVKDVLDFISVTHTTPRKYISEVHDFLLVDVDPMTGWRNGLAALSATLQVYDNLSRAPGREEVTLIPAGAWFGLNLK